MASMQTLKNKLPNYLGSQGKKHAALRGNPKSLALTPEEWRNINRRIKKTTDMVLSRNYVLDGFGPGAWELHTNLGVALLAEVIVRPLKTQCSLSEPNLKAKIRAMANDATHREFRHTYDGGKVWFRFRMLDLENAMKPLDDDTTNGAEKPEGDDKREVEEDAETSEHSL